MLFGVLSILGDIKVGDGRYGDIKVRLRWVFCIFRYIEKMVLRLFFIIFDCFS